MENLTGLEVRFSRKKGGVTAANATRSWGTWGLGIGARPWPFPAEAAPGTSAGPTSGNRGGTYSRWHRLARPALMTWLQRRMTAWPSSRFRGSI